MSISTLDEYLATIPNDDNRARMVEVLNWVAEHYPELELRIACRQPTFTHHGTHINRLSTASKYIAMFPEHATMICFKAAGHGLSVRLLGGRPWETTGGPLSRIRWRTASRFRASIHPAYRRCAWTSLG